MLKHTKACPQNRQFSFRHPSRLKDSKKSLLRKELTSNCVFVVLKRFFFFWNIYWARAFPFKHALAFIVTRSSALRRNNIYIFKQFEKNRTNKINGIHIFQYQFFVQTCFPRTPTKILFSLPIFLSMGRTHIDPYFLMQLKMLQWTNNAINIDFFNFSVQFESRTIDRSLLFAHFFSRNQSLNSDHFDYMIHKLNAHWFQICLFNYMMTRHWRLHSQNTFNRWSIHSEDFGNPSNESYAIIDEMRNCISNLFKNRVSAIRARIQLTNHRIQIVFQKSDSDTLLLKNVCEAELFLFASDNVKYRAICRNFVGPFWNWSSTKLFGFLPFQMTKWSKMTQCVHGKRICVIAISIRSTVVFNIFFHIFNLLQRLCGVI